MAAEPPDPIETVLDGASQPDRSLLLLNRETPKPVVTLLEEAFENHSLTVADRDVPNGAGDVACLVEDGEIVATTSLSELEEAFLLVNADRYRSGTKQIRSGSFPDVLTALNDTEFTVRGFPKSNREKLLLILISRFIEHRALDAGDGRLRATFQRLSRLDDERGTKQVYSWLADSGVDTHVYGVDDDPEAVPELDVSVHTGRNELYRRSWFVVFRPPEGGDGVALVAIETGENVWRGMWTRDADRVRQVDSYLEAWF